MRLQEIEARLAAIRNELETRAAELTAEAIEALETEVNDLTEERTRLLDAQERRTNLLNQIAGNAAQAEGGVQPTVLRTFGVMDGRTEGGETEDAHGTMAYRRAFMEYVCRGTAIPAEYRATGTTKTTDVGAVIPTNVVNTIVQKLESTGKILAKVTRTAYKGGVSIPKSSVKPEAKWVAEGATSEKQKYTTDTVTFAYHKLRCAVAVSLEMDTMAISAFESLIVNNIVEAMTKALEQAIISGNGAGQPKGIIKETAPEGQTVEVGEIAYQNLIDAEAALPVAYEKGAEWCMSKKTFMQYYGLLDTNGQPIGRVNYGLAGAPEYTLLGRVVNVVDYLPSFAAASIDTIVGFLFNFKDYVLNTNYAMGIKKYEDNETDDQVTKGIMIADGKVVDENSLVLLKKVNKV